MMPARCAHCPVPGDAPCAALTRPHPRFCQLVDPDHPDHNPAYRAILVGLPPEKPARRAEAPPASDLDVRLAMAAETCAHGSGHCGCGGKPRTCSRDGRPPEVFRADCLLCVARDWWEAGVEAGW